MSIFEKLKSFFDRKNSNDIIIKNLNIIKNDLIEELSKYALNDINSSGKPVMMETDENDNLLVYPNKDDYLYDISYSIYINKFDNISNKIKEKIRDYVDELCSCELAYNLGKLYSKEYHEWENEFYKDADSIEEEMWNFEIKGELKYKGFIERAAENADNYKGNINLDITPNLENKEIKLKPYIEHDEDPNEVVSLEDGSIELLPIEIK